ncbi:GCN5 family acetyltransferase [Mesobacillus campisalis]|uniref:GCN5 family acetyltransferase n=1 Tax=Mesobacillus campisalis TaxID=1408103 RepID=A0A0M2SUP9_9BACI|nr:GNAT family N-acetyltransferase [Mesobacillus campisalis]KKK37431.1 GCN5 family acetyltransferase [Mesobacillus campisalis]
MKTIQYPCIKLKESIDQEDYAMIRQLQERCIQEDETALKLELDYKLGAGRDGAGGIKEVNEFMYFDGQALIGYIGICRFGGPWEVNGMVHPDYRRQGVFKKLSELVLEEWKRRNSDSMLLLCDREAEAGQRFIAKKQALYAHSEYEMFLRQDAFPQSQNETAGITFRKAANADAKEIARQNAIYFNGSRSDANEEAEIHVLPEEEEKRGMPCYLAEKDGEIVGKVNLQMTSQLGAIFGLGVVPEHRRNGYGRAILLMAIQKLKEAGAKNVMLQVAAENANALNLYKSCGFETTSTMDYYQIQ